MVWLVLKFTKLIWEKRNMTDSTKKWLEEWRNPHSILTLQKLYVSFPAFIFIFASHNFCKLIFCCNICLHNQAAIFLIIFFYQWGNFFLELSFAWFFPSMLHSRNICCCLIDFWFTIDSILQSCSKYSIILLHAKQPEAKQQESKKLQRHTKYIRASSIDDTDCESKSQSSFPRHLCQ